MPIANYTTKAKIAVSIADIEKHLLKLDVREISKGYDEKGEPVSLRFVIHQEGLHLPFCLPARHEGVLKVMRRDGVARSFLNEAQARRVAWRILKDWVRAQVALIESGLAERAEVFLPYLLVSEDQTLFERAAENPQHLLPSEF